MLAILEFISKDLAQIIEGLAGVLSIIDDSVERKADLEKSKSKIRATFIKGIEQLRVVTG